MAQDYRARKLRGKSFRGKDLNGADFSYSNIRGVDFTDANLEGANFSHAQTGIQRRWAIVLVGCALLLSALSGLLSAIGGCLVGILLLDSNRENLYVGIVSLIVLTIFFLITLFRGVSAAFGFMALSVTCTGLAAVGWAGIVAVTWAGGTVHAGAMELAQVVAVVVTGAVAVVATILGTVVIAGAVTLAGAVAGLISVTLTISIAAVLSGAMSVMAVRVNPIAGTVAIVTSVVVILLSAYVGCSALYEDEKQITIRNLALAIATRYGTKFQGCNLTDADFTRASVKNANFIKANLTRTCWFEVKKLNLAIVDKSYLVNQTIRKLVVHKDLQNQNFDGWDLQGINLRAANLIDASLVGTKLNNTDLQNANLSRANLMHSQVDNTNFRAAILTGAYIENWGITPQTQLEDVECDYIFTRVPTKNNPNPQRLPANWDETFKPGEFARFFSPLSRTLN
ncbi:MAG: pentapeptide repeat-containing protein [Calothrix sp. C42_A2020_038]|nr:pentapeptide repeat-containing protein [Calothrix sp. C42_A2020_038]